MNKYWKRITKLILVFLILNIAMGTTQTVYAEDKNESSQEQLGALKDNGKSYYHLDAVPDDFNEEKSFADKVTDKFWFLDVKDKAGQKMNEFFNYLVNVAFDMNILMTNFMISSLDFAYNFNFINLIIDKLDSIMQQITGVTGIGNFSSNGIFGNLAKFVAVFTVIYAIFLMVWKRSMFSSFGTILQTVLALTIALLLFTNYSTFLSGLNQVTTQASSLILASDFNKQNQNGSQKVENAAPTNLNEESLKREMKDNLWTLFVDRPYLYMMYGETNLNNIGNNISKEEAINRINKILKNEPNSESRYKAISNEINKGNNYLLYDNISKRLSFTPLYLAINGITSLPVYFLALALLLFQFWFMLIAIFAPFALLFGAMPGQFNVVKRYFIELGLPLVLKIVVAFSALIIFAISELLYQADFTATQSGNPFMGYIAAALIHFVLFMLLFFLRKRIKNIFAAGSQGVQEIREGVGDFSNPLKKRTQGLATTYGAAIGGVATGGTGALAGANIGSSVGKMATGEGSVGDVAKSGMQAKRSKQLSSLEREDDSEAITGLDKLATHEKPSRKNVNANATVDKLDTPNTSGETGTDNQDNDQNDSMPSLNTNRSENAPIKEGGTISPVTEEKPEKNQSEASLETNKAHDQTKNMNEGVSESLSSSTSQSNTSVMNSDQLNVNQSNESFGGTTTGGNLGAKDTLFDKDSPKTIDHSTPETQQHGEPVNTQMSKQDDLANLASLEEHIPPVENEQQTDVNDYAELE
ncbi:CD3337/EF1877 family mobilome membrane protein [Lentibacillus cibarius]|uniref:Uncharacterized protein n=1 Tax=Lentibacillus cibarius TaxID=2583219 RepID=A0A5S3R6N6_9BACI|nr:hypothetical protein [Lentibacillus cibarius]TMN20853.1 hypothetical protein FFL34_01045 [Lentibacillus cibarius]